MQSDARPFCETYVSSALFSGVKLYDITFSTSFNNFLMKHLLCRTLSLLVCLMFVCGPSFAQTSAKNNTRTHSSQKKATNAQTAKSRKSASVGSQANRKTTARVSSSSRRGIMTEAQKKKIIQNLLWNMVYIPGGTFRMGATSEQGNDAWDDEKPARVVTVGSYCIGRFEVTQQEWEAVMGNNPSVTKGARLPVTNVSWEDCNRFVDKLSRITGKSFRLPTEAEWEFAARGRTNEMATKYSGGDNLDALAWFSGNSSNSMSPHDVGTKNPNELGLFDMSGNVREWCYDCYGSYSNIDKRTNPVAPNNSDKRVLRGGCFFSPARECRVSVRFCDKQDEHYFANGFRIVRHP